MKHKLKVKYSLISALFLAVAMCLLGLPFDGVEASPPEPNLSPAMDNISTKLKAYQTSAIEPSQSNGRLLTEAPSLSQVNVGPSDSTFSPPVEIITKLQPYQTPGVQPSQSDGRQLQRAPLPSEEEEPPIDTLAQRTFYAIADATVLRGYPSLNFGDTTDMWAGYDEYLEPDGEIARSLVKFNIDSLPSNQNITKARLRVYLVISWDYPNTRRTIRTYRITHSWSESNVAWNNKPGYGSAYGSSSIVHGAWGWYEFDVTNLVRAWYGGTYTNHGIMLRGPEVSGVDASWRGFSTREGPYTPRLVVDYSPPAPQVNSITPNTGANTGVVHITNLAGANFQSGATVKLSKTGQANISATNVDVVSPSRITCDFDLTGAATGAWNVVVTNPDSQSGTLPAGFSVTQQEQWIYMPIIVKNAGAPQPCLPDVGDWTGQESQRGYPVSFTVTSQCQVHNFRIKVPFLPPSYCQITILEDLPIVDGRFSFSYFGASISGEFDSSTNASGTYSVIYCDGTLITPPSQGTWQAHR